MKTWAATTAIQQPTGSSSQGWALVSEPGFWDFQIIRLLIFEIWYSCKMLLGNLVVRYRGKIIKVSWIGPGQNGRFSGHV